MIGWAVFNGAVTVALVYFGIYTTVLHHKIDRLERTPGPPGPQGPAGPVGPRGEPGTVYFEHLPEPVRPTWLWGPIPPG